VARSGQVELARRQPAAAPRNAQPTGCRSVLDACDILDIAGKRKAGEGKGSGVGGQESGGRG